MEHPAGQVSTKKIWIDLDNSPHVPFFAPIIEELQKRRYSLLVTARDAFQVRELTTLLKIECELIGHHYGKNKLFKVTGLFVRAGQLARTVLNAKPDLAISHGSRSQVLLAALLRIPSILIFDYEFAQGLRILHPQWLMAPEVVADCARMHKGHMLKYSGLKEDVYVPRFTPDPSIRAELGLREDHVIVTLRPPANEAHYHNPESEALLDAVLNLVSKTPDIRVVLLPRNARQERRICASWPALFESGKLMVPRHAIDGLNLIWHSDLVISGGGTMNREAASLGIPVYSIFRGRIGAIDRYLADSGRLVLIENVEDVNSKIRLHRRGRSAAPLSHGYQALTDIVDNIVQVAESC